jgi:o-succinylbenzoate---CoA ligase
MGQNTIKAAALRMSSYSLPEPPGAFFDLIAGGADHPDALHSGGRWFSRERLRADAAHLAQTLAAAGVETSGVLAVQCHDPQVTARLLYAALWRGCALFPLDPGLDPARRDALLHLAGTPLLVADAGLAPPSQRPLLPERLPALPSAPAPQPPPPGRCGSRPRLQRIQLVIATSGTTGAPKGVMLSRRNLWRAARAANRRLGLGVGDRWLNALPLFHIGGLSIFYRALTAGAGVVLQEGFRPEAVWRALHEHGITHLSLVPPMLERLLRVAEGPPPPRLRVVLIGGGPLSPRLAGQARQLGWPICASYGLSEAASQVATDCGPKAGAVAGRVGRPLPGMRVKTDQGGRLRLRGGAVMAGYLNPGLRPGDGLEPDGGFLTSDLGHLEDDGVLRLQGRADELLVSGGRNIHPAEVEALLQRCPAILEAAVAGQPDELWGQRVVAWYRGTISPPELERINTDNDRPCTALPPAR